MKQYVRDMAPEEEDLSNPYRPVHGLLSKTYFIIIQIKLGKNLDKNESTLKNYLIEIVSRYCDGSTLKK